MKNYIDFKHNIFEFIVNSSYGYICWKDNKAPRSKLRGINYASQAASFQLACAASSGEFDPKRLK
jgi:hypothetical protein